MQSNQSYIKTVLLFIIVALIVPSCFNKNSNDNSLKNSEEIVMENCILETKISQKKVEAFEKDMGSEKLTNAGEEISYKRMGMRDSLPYVVTYKFAGDSVILVKYRWSNLPGQKDEMINCLTYLTALLKKRTGSDPIFKPDIHRKEADYSTRIDFSDTYTWNKTKSTNYTAWMLFHDSGRQGESYLLLEINFDD